MRIQQAVKRAAKTVQKRKGATLVLAAFCMIGLLGFIALVVDVGYVALTRAQVQAAADSAALGAALELPDGLGTGAISTTAEVDAECKVIAIEMAEMHKAGDLDSITCDAQDVRLGNIVWNAVTGLPTKTYGTAPYNFVEVTLARTDNSADGPLGLFFAPIIGTNTAGVQVTATAALVPGDGFKIESGSTETTGLLPIAVDWPTWNDLQNANAPGGLFTDNYTYNEETGAVTSGSDGILEMDIYPNGTTQLPPGNRGTVDLGSPNNSTADLSRQILYGLNEYDLSFFTNNTVKASWEEPLILNADTGLSAGIKDELAAIIGDARAIPIFSEVGGGGGNNANYTIIKFVGIRILDVKLTGSPSGKHVTIQPATYVGKNVVRSKTKTIEDDSIYAPAFLSH